MFSKNSEEKTNKKAAPTNAPPLTSKKARPIDAPPVMPARSPVSRAGFVRRARDYSDPSGENPQMGPYGDGKKLIVGRDIALNGEISSCEKLVVEGRVEANIKDCREIEIAESGMFKGEAVIAIAEISGKFEGTMEAGELLIIRSTGHVSGDVRYVRLEIERGGIIEGNITMMPEASNKD
jgi:cytoskeletal protein CcmA (bactofilin family)